MIRDKVFKNGPNQICGRQPLKNYFVLFLNTLFHIWRVATIIPLLKAGKSPSEVASFRPISLTSCVVKLLERIIADRLYYIAETNNMFSRFQAGFRKGRSCEDQITRIVQAIEDGFQQPQCNAPF